MRVVALARSARGAARARPERGGPLMVALHGAVLVGGAAHVLLVGAPPPPGVLGGALLALAAATGLRLWTLRTLGGRWNVRVVEPDAIVTGGPYRFIRHPNYLAVVLELAALPLAIGAPWLALAATVANALVLGLRIPFEEEALARRHEAYRRVLMRRPRFVPGPGPR
jgi:methyltransferase